EDVLARALAKDSGDRYENGAGLLADTRRALGLEVRTVRWPLAVAAVGLSLIGAALLSYFLTRGSGSASAAHGGRLVRIDSATNRVVGSAAVGDGPSAVAVGSDRVWVASYHDGTLWRFEPSSGDAAKIPAFGRPYAVTIHNGGAYVAALGPGR